MAIMFYTGLPRAGKTHSVVEHVILPALQAGRVVCTNIQIAAKVSEEHPERVRGLPGEGERWCDLPPGAVVVVDEAWRLWPAGMQANKIPEDDREFFAMHGHRLDGEGRSQQIVLISQRAEDCSKFLRGLCEQRFQVVKLAAVGARGKYRVDVFDGVDMIEARKVRSIFGTYQPAIFEAYKSHTAVTGAVSTVDEKRIDDRGTVWNSFTVRFGLPLAVVVMVLGAWRLYGWFNPPPPEAMSKAQALTATPGGAVSTGPPGVAGQAGSSSVKDSARWRVGADLERNGELFVWLVDGSDRLRQVPGSKCRRVNGEVGCIVDGERVTPWTGTVRGVSVLAAASSALQEIKK